MVRRGAEIVAFGLLFRLQEYLIAWGWAPWTDLFRVDVLNVIGLSMIFMAVFCGLILTLRNRGAAPPDLKTTETSAEAPVATLVSAAVAVVALIALLTPPLYTTWRPTWLPWELESYIDGCHNLGAPQPWLFCMFPWTAFAFAGLAAGFILFSERARERTASILAGFAAVGAAAILIAYALDHSSIQLYATYDYWHTSPNFLMMRVGMLLMICLLAYAWLVPPRLTHQREALGPSASARSSNSARLPCSSTGSTSNSSTDASRFSLSAAVGIATATRGLIEIFLFMLILSIARTRFDWKKIDWSRFRWKTMERTPQQVRTD